MPANVPLCGCNKNGEKAGTQGDDDRQTADGNGQRFKKYIGRNVALQWCALAANAVMVFAVGNLESCWGSRGAALPAVTAAVLLAAAAVRFCVRPRRRQAGLSGFPLGKKDPAGNDL